MWAGVNDVVLSEFRIVLHAAKRFGAVTRGIPSVDGAIDASYRGLTGTPAGVDGRVQTRPTVGNRVIRPLRPEVRSARVGLNVGRRC